MSKVDTALLTESDVERAVALAIDFDGGYTGISAQPFELQLRDGSLHVPDFAVRRSNGSLAIVDVRPRDRRDEASARKFDDMTFLMSWAALEYHVISGPSVVQQFNLRFLAAFSRRPRLWTECRPALVHMSTASPTITWGELRHCLRDTFGLDRLWAQPVVGHAVWVGLLSTDMGVPISDTSTLAWTPTSEMAVVR